MKYLTFITILLVAVVSTPVRANIDQAADYLCSEESVELSNQSLKKAIEAGRLLRMKPEVSPAEIQGAITNIHLAQIALESLILQCAILKALGTSV